MASAQKLSKKRSAPSQGGPAAKKSKQFVNKKADVKKRSRPITLPRSQPTQNSDESEDDDDNSDEGDDFGLDNDEYPELENEGDDEMQTDEPTAGVKPKDPNAARESHKAQKALLTQRRAQKPHFDLLSRAKSTWALARQKNIPSSERQKHIKDLMDVLRGNVRDIVFKHDASRIVQTAVKYGGQKERDEIALELKGRYKDLAQNRYSKFLVTKLIRYSTHRASILQEFQSSVIRLLLHREATSVLADSFELYANAFERSILLRDFYGKETLLFSTNLDSDKEKARKGLAGVLEGIDEEKKKRILNATKENVMSIFNNEDKGAVTHSVVHRALWEYLSALSSLTEDDQEKRFREMFEGCQDTLAELVHTKDGSRVVREFLARGTAKDRKQILKVLKPHIERMCTDDEAQLVLFTALDVIDDTKMVSKTILSSILTPSILSTLSTSPQGRRTLFYLLVPRTKRHFTPSTISSLSETDSIRSKTSKKDSQVRENEIREAASEALIEWVVKEGKEKSRDPGASLVIAEIMLCATGDKSQASNTLLDALNTPYPSLDSSNPNPIDLSHTSRLYKTLLQGGHFNHSSKSIKKVSKDTWNPTTFASSFVDRVDEETIVGMCTKGDANGCFVVAELVEALMDEEDGATGGKEKIKKVFGTQVKKEIEGGEAKGKKVLLEKLARL